MNSVDRNITGLILSAGLSARMKKFKPLLKINSETFISAIVRKLLIICKDVVIVTGYNGFAIEAEIRNLGFERKCRIVQNENYEKGMFSSLQKGIETIKTQWVIYHFVDQPSLHVDFYKAFANQISDNYDWIQPVNKGQKGHPIIFNQKVCSMILSKDTNSSLRDISHNTAIRKYLWNYESDLIYEDIDTIEDYKKL